MAETIFASENIKELTLEQSFAILAFIFANIPPFAENLLLRDRPRNRGDNHRKNNQPENLRCDFHLKRFCGLPLQKAIANRKIIAVNLIYALPSRNAFRRRERDG